MKNTRMLIGGLLACLITLTTVATVSAEEDQGIVKVVNVKGAARYTTANGGSWKAIKVGQILKQGAVIQTADGSYVDVVLNNPNAVEGIAGGPTSSNVGAEGTPPASSMAHFQPKVQQDAIRIFENSVLSVDKLTVNQTGADKVTDTELDLKAGSIFGTVKKLSAASKYEIKVPEGVAGIRGTIYFISANGILRVLTGSVVISFVKNGHVITEVVGAGNEFNPNTGKVEPISNPVLKELSQILQALHFTGNMPPTTYTHGASPVYHVSPTDFKSGGGGGGGTGSGTGAL